MSSKYTSPLIPLEDSADEFAVEYSSEGYGTEDIGFRHDQLTNRKKTSIVFNKRTLVCWLFLGTAVVCVIGILLGRFVFAPHTDSNAIQTTVKPPEDHTSSEHKLSYEELQSILFKEMKADNIRKNLQTITSKPHVAGTQNDEKDVVDFVSGEYKKHLDKVEVFPYDILLSYPNVSDANYLSIVFPNGSETTKSNWIEKPLTNFEKQPGVLPAFNAYGAAGDAIGNLFYVNYGMVEDYEYLTEVGINVTGGICMARYGHIFRGDKAHIAAAHKCAGLVIYTDPYDYSDVAKNSWDPSMGNKNTYQNKWWMPPTGVQRGTVSMLNGDPLTPGYPALNFTYRIPESDVILPKIPVQPISYSDAYNYFSILGGKVAPEKWQGGLNISYKLGGSFDQGHQFCKVKLHVGNYRERRTIHTIIGYIRGWQEPDRYVLLGNHRDAWIFGGTDPSSGTAVVLEVARALGSVVKGGKWRPRRTIVFCNWGAEEFGLMGSTEWVEQMEKKLMLRAVSYLNIDIAVQGNETFRGLSTPSLYQVLFNVTSEVPNPDPGEVLKERPTVYDTWLAKDRDQEKPNRPFVSNIGSGSDFTMFIQKTGVACADLRYTFTNKQLSSYPVYHSVHDTFEYVQKFIDPDFNVSLAIAKIAAGALLRLGDSLALPMSPLDYADKLLSLANLLERNSGKLLESHEISLKELYRVIGVFNQSAMSLDQNAKALNSSSDPVYVRQINDKLFYVNRGFLDFNGIPSEPYYRHVIFAPSSHNSYNGAAFPGITDAIFDAKRGGSWDEVRKACSVVCTQILAAADLMIEV